MRDSVNRLIIQIAYLIDARNRVPFAYPCDSRHFLRTAHYRPSILPRVLPNTKHPNPSLNALVQSRTREIQDFPTALAVFKSIFSTSVYIRKRTHNLHDSPQQNKQKTTRRTQAPLRGVDNSA